MRRQLVIVAAATTLLVALAFLVPLAVLVNQVAAERAMTQARLAASSLTPVLIGDDAEQLALAIESAEATAGVDLAVVHADGGTSGLDGPLDAGERDAVARARAGQAFQRSDPAGDRVLYTPVVGPDGRVDVVRTVVAAQRLDAGVFESWAILAAVGSALVAAAILVADRLGRSVVRPSRAVAAAARRLSEGEREIRAPVEGPPELADIAAALNALADRIDGLLVAERESAADLAHRLRTPLTALRLDAEALGADAAARRVRADLDELERAVDRLIREHRSPDAAAPGRPADLVAVTVDRASFWRALADEEGRELAVDVPSSPVHVRVDGEQLSAAIDALLGNVMAHTPPGSDCAVRVELENERTARLEVEDDGPGFVAPESLERGRSGRGSTGLGLDIVRRTAASGGGEVRIETGDGGGARVVVRLPRADFTGT